MVFLHFKDKKNTYEFTYNDLCLTIKIKNDNQDVSYSDILIYCLQSRVGAAGFPSDKEFTEALSNRDVYHMYKKNREYLLIEKEE